MFSPFNLIAQQWQSILRWLLTSAGTYLAASGVVTAEQWNTATPLIMTAVGALVSLGSFAWSVHSNQAKVIKATADKLVAQGK